MSAFARRPMSVRASVAVCVGIALLTPARPARGGQAGKGPVKVFILSGQSNMQGAGKVKMDPNKNEGKGTLEYLVKNPETAERYRHTVDAAGNWVVRDDVWIWYMGRKGGLSVGYGAGGGNIGPEFQFGHVMGDFFDNQVLIIKIAWGGKSIQKDFRPPSSGGDVGPFYTDMIRLTKEVLADIRAHFPAYDGRGYEIAGFGWHQGWNDGCSMGACQEYEENLVNLIRDVRKELGVAHGGDLPWVTANSGFGGRNQRNSRRVMIMDAQAAAAGHEDFKGTVVCVETRDFFRPPEESPTRQGYHWNGNAGTYFLIGDAMGEAMKKLCGKGSAAKAAEVEKKKKAAAAAPPARPPRPSVDPNEAKAKRLFKSARSAERMGQRSAAVSLYERLVEQYAGTAAAKLARERLDALGR